MNVLEIANSFEKHICDKADSRRIPIGATFELTPCCNMNCKMCYVRMSREDMIKQGGLLSGTEWISILESAKNAGTLFLLLTGGEPLLHPDFKEIYLAAKQLGFVVCVNTNGTLINEEMADFFAENRPRRLNISIYGGNDQTYEKLCANPNGFTQFQNCIQLLKEREVAVKLNCSLTAQNYEDLEEMISFAKQKDLPIEVASYMFPPVRKNGFQEKVENRLTLEQQVAARIYYEKMVYGKEGFTQKAKAAVYCIDHDVELPPKSENKGFSCRSGTSTYWVNWKGDMIPCGMFTVPKVNVKKTSIQEAFWWITEEVLKLKRADQCYQCKKEYICQICSAAAFCETGKIDGVSKHHCDACDLYVEQLRKYLEENHVNME